jgi:WD40 repeat protein
MAQADQGVEKFAWSPDGTVGVAIINDRAVALTPGQSARALADDISAITFGWDSETVYAVRITPDGGDDVAEVIQIDFASGDSSVLGSTSYPRPVIGPDPALREAQFIDNGGLVRLYAVADGNLALWVLGAPAIYRIDTGDGRVSEISREPILWSPDGEHRIDLSENANGTTQIILRDTSGDSVASVQVSGLVSHVRWVRSSNEIVFTLGRLGASGGVRQDLYVWDLQNGKAPMALTSNGTSFGAEWLGVAPNWLP